MARNAMRPRTKRSRWIGVLLVYVLVAAGCAAPPTPTPTPVPTPLPAISATLGATVRASGKIVPVRAAELSFTVGGCVVAPVAAVGDTVEAGQLLLALDDTTAAIAVAQAEAAQLRATAQLDDLEAGPRPQEIAAAQARLQAAQAHLAQLQEAARPEQIAAAQAELDAAQAGYDALYAASDPAIVAAAWAKVSQAQAALDRLRHPATPSQIAEAQAHVQSVEAEKDLLTAGARMQTITAARAAVAEAEANLRRAEADLANMELRAPFDGTVTARRISPGELAQPAQVVVVLADLGHLQVETTDLSERDVVRVAEGQPVTVVVTAVGMELPGRVASITPQSTIIGGDVVYTVYIDLEEQPPALRWGMSVDVEIEVE